MNAKGFASASIIILVLLILTVALGAGVYFYSQKTTLKNTLTKQSQAPFSTPAPSLSADIAPSTPSKPRDRFEIKLPSNIKLSERSFEVSVETTDEIRKRYEEIITGQIECPGPCSEFTKNPDLVEKQFDILYKASKAPNCSFDDNLTKEIEKDFWVFASAGEQRDHIEGIYNANLDLCGIKYLGPDGYDVDINNLRYKVGFLKDNRVIRIDFILLPPGIFEEVDQLVNKMGHTSDGYCDESCSKKELHYFENYYDYPETRIIIKSYDDSVKTLKLID
jgi:hypothetical protein